MTTHKSGAGASQRQTSRDPGSVSVAAAKFLQGDGQAGKLLGQFFWKRVVGLARQKLKQRAIPQKHAGASDVAQDVLLAFFRAVRAGKYEFLNGRDGMWALLARITDNKVKDLQRRRRRRRGMEPLSSAGLEASLTGEPARLSELAVDGRPAPADEAEYAEACLAACQSVLARLNERQQRIVLSKAAGRTNAQVAKELGCTERTVELNLAAIRKEARKVNEESGIA